MNKTKNTAKSLVETYKECVKEADAKNPYGKSFNRKKALNLLKEIGQYSESMGQKFTPTDIEFLDGYFIFTHGTDSVVHFRIKEIKGWKMGLWIDAVEKKGDNAAVEFFTQYEHDIDKFKPTASEFVVSGEFGEEKIEDCFDMRIFDTLNYIKKHPQLAWYKNAFYTDYNTEYVSRAKATLTHLSHILYDKKYELKMRIRNKKEKK